MKVKNIEIYQAFQALPNLCKKEIPSKFGYPLARLTKKLALEANVIEETRSKIIQKYGTVEGDKVSIEPESKNWADFVKELNDLMNIEVELDVQKVKLPGQVEVTIEDLMKLEAFVEEAEEVK